MRDLFKYGLLFIVVILALYLSLIFVFSGFSISTVADLVIPENKYDQGYEEGYATGYQVGLEAGRKAGYNKGYNDGTTDTVALYRSLRNDPPANNVTNVLPDTSASWVYITDSGSKYHKSGCSYLKSSNKVSLSDAVARGYEPCSRCY